MVYFWWFLLLNFPYHGAMMLCGYYIERTEVINEMMPYLKPVYDELMEKRKICEEYLFLKNGRLGWIVRMCLKLKSMNKK